jgi:hypothetical protein
MKVWPAKVDALLQETCSATTLTFPAISRDTARSPLSKVSPYPCSAGLHPAMRKMFKAFQRTWEKVSAPRITSREIVPAGRISPLFLRASEVPTIVPCCFRMLFWQQERLALRRWTGTISREAGLFWGWRSACVTGRTSSASDLLGRIRAPGAQSGRTHCGGWHADESLCHPSPMEIWLFGGRTHGYASTSLT